MTIGKRGAARHNWREDIGKSTSKEQLMGPNPLLKRLGLADTDRAAIIHVDGVGMCQASLAAFTDLVDFGLGPSGPLRGPLPWLPGVAGYLRSLSAVDMGVHLKLDC